METSFTRSSPSFLVAFFLLIPRLPVSHQYWINSNLNPFRLDGAYKYWLLCIVRWWCLWQNYFFSKWTTYDKICTNTSVNWWAARQPTLSVWVSFVWPFLEQFYHRIPQKLLWAFALWSGPWWTNIQSWTLFMCCFSVILWFCINFADGSKPCWPSYRVTQDVWMGLLGGSFQECKMPVEVPAWLVACQHPGKPGLPSKDQVGPALPRHQGALWCCNPTWILDSMQSRDQLIELRNKPNSLNISRSWDSV